MKVPDTSMPRSEEVLKILKEVKDNPNVTQRELSIRLGISLGKINFLLKALIEKGFIKTRNFKTSGNKKAYWYILTPSGIEAKAKITLHFLKRKLQEYEQIEKQIQLLKKEVSDTETYVSEARIDPKV